MPLPETSEPLTRVCLSDAAYARLRDWILDGTLAPDEALRDEELAEALGMSRTPVREALRRLTAEGFVVTSATRRSYVSPVTLKQAREVYPIVAALEPLALRLTVPRLDDDARQAMLATMRAANQQLAEALAVGDAEAANRADETIHQAFIERCGNDELIGLLRELRSKVRRIERVYWGTADRTPSLRDHAQLIEALADGAWEAAQRALARNCARSIVAATTPAPHE